MKSHITHFPIIRFKLPSIALSDTILYLSSCECGWADDGDWNDDSGWAIERWAVHVLGDYDTALCALWKHE